MSKSTNAARPDRRYKNPASAPPIVSEKRLTFFLPSDTFKALRLQSGRCQVANASGSSETSAGELPETPSALTRMAIDYWLDHFRPARERTRTDEEWEAVIQDVRAAQKV